MHRTWKPKILCFIAASGSLTCLLFPQFAEAQQLCPNGIRVTGTVTDPTGAVIPGATIEAAGAASAIADAAGLYALACVPKTSATVTASADGFASATASLPRTRAATIHLDLKLALANVQTDVQVNADIGADGGGATAVLNAQQVQQLPDDPDDLLRQLQILASADGGDPNSATITVDGFQNAGVIPPKSSIASVRVNPDLFSSEYAFPPFGGGLIQIFTKPGADSLRGAAFFTGSDGSFNATDPFSLTSTPASKRRYGFELSGPIVRERSGYSLALEKRDIDEFNIVNATTLSADGTAAPQQQAVAAPQRLWIASARADWQATPSDLATLSYAAKVNHTGNQGVGGLVLPQAGYDSLINEYDLRFTNRQTLSASAVHETFLGYTWKRTEESPVSTAPSVQVSGAFTGGGATAQGLNDRERNLEIDDDLLLTRGNHSLKFGAQALGIFVHDYDPDTFNGAYVFGGGSAPVLDASNNATGATTTITGLEQYRRALLDLPGGAPTTYQITTGEPVVPVNQWRFASYAEDDIKLHATLTASAGARYQLQTAPGSFAMFDPRLSLNWTPDKKQTWVIHVRGGLFHHTTQGPSYATEVERLNGVRQQQTTVYSPSYATPLAPVAGSIQVGTLYQFPPFLNQTSTFAGLLSVDHEFPQHWHTSVHFYWGEDWGNVMLRNINAPLLGNSIGAAPDPTAALLAPRPIAAGENIFEYQNSGHLAGNVVTFIMDQHDFKRFGFYANYHHMNFKASAHDGVGPQSSYSNSGEDARVDWLRENGFFLYGSYNLPYKVQLSVQFNTEDGAPYNITTGTDNNGDGTFNDRPAYAPAGASGAGVYGTRFGLLTDNTVNGNVPRNLGTMPALLHLDSNLSRVFALNGMDKDHPRTLTVNARAANLLNHTNVTAVQTVLSPTLGQGISAETGRRIELGVRLAF